MYKRSCPTCKKTIEYTSKNNRNSASKKKSLCIFCTRRKFEPEFYENLYRNCPSCGEKVDYRRFGDKIKAFEAKSTCKRCMINSGKFVKGGNRANTKPVYDCWISKYGKKKADELDKIRKEKWSKLMRGSGNPMYGRPSPSGSGNGWSG